MDLEWLDPFFSVAGWLAAAGTIWLFGRSLNTDEEPPPVLVAKFLTTVLLFCLFVRAGQQIAAGNPFKLFTGLFCAMGMAGLWSKTIGELIAKPFAGLYTDAREAEARPLYSQAIAQRMQSHFAECERLLRAQLEKFPKDFEGQMMLASLQAENLQDLPGALATIEGILAQTCHPENQLAYALTTVADWQVQFARDPDAARGALERIQRLFPDTSLALTASQRIAHLETKEELAARDDERARPMPEFERDIGLRGLKSSVRPREESPEEMTARFVRRLEKHPLDWEAREELARLYATHYDRMDLAAAQLEQLIAVPNQPPQLVVHWLTLLAELQLEHGKNTPAARAAWQRIVDLFPGSAFATRAEMAIHQLPVPRE